MRALLLPLRYQVETDDSLATLDRWLAEHKRGTDGVASVYRSSKRVVILAGPLSGHDMAGYVWKTQLPPASTSSSATVVLSGHVRPYLPMYFGLLLSLTFVPLLVFSWTALTTLADRLTALSVAAAVVAWFWAPLFTSNARAKRELVLSRLADLLPPPTGTPQCEGP